MLATEREFELCVVETALGCELPNDEWLRSGYVSMVFQSVVNEYAREKGVDAIGLPSTGKYIRLIAGIIGRRMQ